MAKYIVSPADRSPEFTVEADRYVHNISTGYHEFWQGADPDETQVAAIINCSVRLDQEPPAP